MENEDFIQKWNAIQQMVKNKFGEKLDEQTILYIIGLQELGKNYTTYKKEEKLDIIHIGVCTVLEKFGYYKFIGNDDDGWPHFKNEKKIPNENDESEVSLIRKAIIHYFDELSNFK